MVDDSQGTGSSPASSIPCAQESPKQHTSQTSTGMSATNQQASQKSTVAHQQQSSLLWPPAPGSHAALGHQGQLQFIQPMVSP